MTGRDWLATLSVGLTIVVHSARALLRGAARMTGRRRLLYRPRRGLLGPWPRRETEAPGAPDEMTECPEQGAESGPTLRDHRAGFPTVA
jgi:hypothetical protein